MASPGEPAEAASAAEVSEAAEASEALETPKAAPAVPEAAYFAYCRAFQAVMRVAAHFLPWREPKVLHNYTALVADLQQHDIGSVLVVTDMGLVKAGLVDGLQTALTGGDISFVRYDDVAPGPTVDDVEAGLALYRQADCQAIVAIGGGSPIDCAKAIAARVARPNRSVQQLRGLLKVRSGVPYLVAVPTTAGTGSETTVAAVITDAATHEKFSINDPALTPHVAVLDPELTVGVPPKVTAATGMDALSHAVEAYIGNSNTRKTRADALATVPLVFENLPKAVADGSDLAARAALQEAAFRGGSAFTRAYVGNVHAASHQLSGMYHTVHGIGNAALMPYVLEMYGPSAQRRLAELGTAAGLPEAGTDSERAEAFIQAIRDLTAEVGLPDSLPEIQDKDIPELAQRAFKEANPLYPVPREFTHQDFEDLYRKVK